MAASNSLMALNGLSLIPRTKLFGNPSRAQGEISPDGRWLSWLAPREGVLNVWVAPRGDLEAARPVTADRKRGISFHAWAHDGTHLLYIQDKDGNENWHWYAVNVATDLVRDLTPIEGVNAELVGLSRDAPGTLIIGLNDRDPRWHDLWRVDLASGERDLLLTNADEFASFTFDHRLELRVAAKTLPSGGKAYFRYDAGRFAEFLSVPPEDELTTGISGFNRAGDACHLVSSVGRDVSALYRLDWNSGRQALLAEHPKADAGGLILDPPTGEPIAVGFTHLKREWTPLTETAAQDLAFLAANLPGEIGVASQTDDGRTWIVTATAAEHPTTYHLFERDRRAVTKLFATRPELEAFPLASMRPNVIKARDGLELVTYLTLPATLRDERPAEPLPMVLNVHGGPWGRDVYGYDPVHQWLSNRGYAVLSVNFRGSSGLGKAFLNAGDHEWGARMHDDLLDAVAWAVEQGVADRSRVAIMGVSYGGYATLAGLAFTPDTFCCGVDIVGPSNLETLLATVPPYWASFFEVLARRVGDPRTEAGRKLLRERSPLHKAGAISKPLLIGQGANDPRVKQAEADQIVDAMRAKGLPVAYILYPDEGHGFVRPENRMSFFAVAEQFLARHLGGRAEPIGADLSGASLQVVEGAAHVPGLEAALAGRPAGGP